MVFLRDLMSVLMVSIWVRTVIGATTNALDVTNKGGTVTNPSSAMEKTVAASLASNRGELSATCHAAAASMTEDVGDCADLLGMVKIRLARDSVSTPIKDWLKTMCAATECSDKALASAAAKLTTGCATEMKDKYPDAGAFYSILTTYKTIRTEACPNIDALEFCDPKLEGHMNKQAANKRPFFSAPKAAYCAECASQINSLRPGFCKQGEVAGPIPVRPIVVGLPAPKETLKVTPKGNPKGAQKGDSKP
ncbi:hypothetical protein PTTG_27137 [Puccinia triticina 1-1 BBBD Race 1]|uniref:Secreted protein n=2 Tax=Puccinia triticina TaxID=208348 RepID=A0A180GPJ8_PUCT1|nr:uncharacterized protein PtA15_2A733 [Puccinia triticina]OAV93893.1 hypothetical protein PTTG_27137 [Puccinia triticina 1-1 BBBD Race 1]WAQ82416.1 hypothetical protein PtA15_2A733 [Puccinia triticina]